MSAYGTWWRPSGGSPEEEQPQNTGPTVSFDPQPMEAPQEPPTEKLSTRRIHILGLGSIGLLVAHALKQLPNSPPITLMMHKPSAFKSFRLAGSVIRLKDKASGVIDEQFDYDVDVQEKETPQSEPFWRYHAAPKGQQRDNPPVHPRTAAEKLPNGETYIHSLILTVKAQNTVAALSAITHRINASSTICLLQNGLGQIDELNTKVFTDPATRPTYLIGVISHGCYTSAHNLVVHAGYGVTSLGIYRDPDKYPLPPAHLTSTPGAISTLSPSDRAKYFPTDEALYTSSLSARFLLRTLTRSTTLCCAVYPYLDLLMLQLEKLSTNALLNPLTTIFDVPNGTTIAPGNPPLKILINLLVSETSLIFRSLPELASTPNITARFSPHRLRTLFNTVAQKTAANSSSMREDIRLARTGTEIDYINGYIVKRGEEMGIKCIGHFMVQQMIKARVGIDQQKEREYVPFEEGTGAAGEVPPPDGSEDVVGGLEWEMEEREGQRRGKVEVSERGRGEIQPPGESN